MNNSGLLGIFLTGLLTGGLTCMAVQGGLLAATLAQRQDQRLKENATKGATVPILSFLITKLIAYTIVGFLLGLLGSAFQLSLMAKLVMQIAVVIFMLGTAGNILNVHPLFRYFVMQPPRFITRMIRKESKSKDFFAPAILGASTVFIPCGTTQAMMALAIASGKPLYGATILFAFILGTSPIFFILGYLATKLGNKLQEKFMRIAAGAIILLALFNLNNAISLTGSTLTFGAMVKPIVCGITWCGKDGFGDSQARGITEQAVDATTVTIGEKGYTPNEFSIKAGTKIQVTLKNIGGQGCTQAFTIPSLGIQKIVPLGQSEIVTFTAPQKNEDVAFMCSMGMYRGVMHVI